MAFMCRIHGNPIVHVVQYNKQIISFNSAGTQRDLDSFNSASIFIFSKHLFL